MDAKIWGPVTWNFLHFLSISYPDNPTKSDIENNKSLLNILGNVIPCNKCKKHFKNMLESVDLDNSLLSKKNYMNLIWDFHNKVNKKLNKKIISFNDFIYNYQSIIDKGSFNPNKIYNENKRLYILLTISSVFILISILYHIIKCKYI